MEEAAQAAQKAKEQSTAASREEAKAAQDSARTAREKLDAWKSLGTTLMVVGGAMTALTASVVKTGVEYNTLQQTSRAALTTLLGGAKQASAQMDKLDAFAKTSPFAKTTFITAQQQMLAFGIEAKKVVPYLDAIGEAVAAAGGSNQQLGEIAFIMAQISSAGKITAQDLMQFGQRGVNAAELIGSQMGKTGAQIRQDITAGALGADQALDALAAGMKEKFDGASANVKLTFAGAMDRVKAAWRDLSADLTAPLVGPNGGGLFVDLLNRVADVLRMFEALPGPIKMAGGALFALVGITALVSGAAIVAKLKWMEFAATLDKLGPMGSRVKGILGGIGSFLTGPWGLALLAAGGALFAFMQAQADARQEAEDYASTLDKVTGAVTDLTRETAVKKLFDDGAIDDANKLGISLELVADAALGVDGAYEQLRNQVAASQKDFNGSQQEMIALHWAGERLIASAGKQNDALEAGKKKAKDAAKANGDLTDSTDEVSDAFREQEQASKELQDALKAVLDVYEALAHGQMSVAESHDKALDSINKLKEAAKEEGVVLDGTNKQSIKFRDSMRDVEQSHYASAKAIVENGGTLADARKEWSAGRDAVIKMLEAKGLDEAAAKAWADKNLSSAKDVELALAAVKDQADALPDKKTIKTEVVGDEVLKQRLQSLKNMLSSIPNVKRVTLESYTVGNRTVSANNAEGGIYHNKVKSFAGGGMEPGIYPFTAGGIHKFAEEYAEAYISMDPRRRSRSEQVYQRVGREMGFSGGGQDLSPLVAEIRALKAELGRPNNVTITENFPVHSDPLSDAWERGKGDPLGSV